MQDRNAELVQNLTQDFARRNEFNESGARLADAMRWINREGGGVLMWGFTGQSAENMGEGVAGNPWATIGPINFSDYAATPNGGPYVTLDGATQYYYRGDAVWNESTTNPFLVWFWAYTTDTTTEKTLTCKWDTWGGNNRRSWRLYLTGTAVPAGTNVFGFQCNDTGLLGGGLSVASTLAPTNNTWYFVGGYFEPSTLQVIAVGAATDTTLTYTSATSSVPNQLFDGAPGSDMYIGALKGAAAYDYWPGKIGIGLARANVPSARIQGHMARLFQATKWFYQE